MKKIIAISTALLMVLPATAQRETSFDGQYWQDQPLPGWETQVRDRIELMGRIEWTTQAPMPKCYYVKEAMFDAYEDVTGIPYSGVHDFCGYVGKDVSFYTFLSAVYNDQSSMYKVNYHLPPYDRLKAGPFYGEVCTSTACYVWGLPIMLFTKYIRDGESVYLDDMGQDLDSMQLYDGFCYSGHIVLISGIGRDRDGTIRHIDIFEGAGPHNKFRSYTRESFQKKMIEEKNGHFYRFDHEKWGGLVSLAPFVEQAPGIPRNFNTDLSPENGERVTFPEGKDVAIDILSKKYRTMELYRDGKLYETHPAAEKGVITLKGLPTGLYSARLVSPTGKSRPVEFQVAQATCEVWYEDGQLYVGGCRDGVYPQGAYIAPNGKINRNYSSFTVARLCVPAGEGRWKVVPNIPEGSTQLLKVNLAGKYGGYWAELITFSK